MNDDVRIALKAIERRQTILWCKEKLRQQFYPRLIEIRPLLRWVIFLELCYLAMLSGLLLGDAVSHRWHMPVNPWEIWNSQA